MTRNEATNIGKRLMREKIICHVAKANDFKDLPYYYKFIKPLQLFQDVSTSYEAVIRKRRIIRTKSKALKAKVEVVKELEVKCKKGFNIKDRKKRFKTYESCFVGEDAVTWMLKNKVAHSRNEAVEMVQLLMDYSIVQHVTQKHQFKDGKKFYQFI
eukprot:UN03012